MTTLILSAAGKMFIYQIFHAFGKILFEMISFSGVRGVKDPFTL